MAAAGARRAAPVRAQRVVAPAGAPAARGTPGRGPRRQVLEEAVELLDVAVGDRRNAPVGGPAARSIAFTSTCSSSRKRSTRPRTRTSSPRSKRPRRRSRRGTRAPGSRRCGRAAPAPGSGRPERASGGPCASRRRPRRPSSPARRVATVVGLGAADIAPDHGLRAGRDSATVIRCSRSAGNAVLTASGHPLSCAPSRAGTTRARRPPRRSRSWAPGFDATRFALIDPRSSSTSSRPARACGWSTG
jgi:hypothetical protein